MTTKAEEVERVLAGKPARPRYRIYRHKGRYQIAKKGWIFWRWMRDYSILSFWELERARQHVQEDMYVLVEEL